MNQKLPDKQNVGDTPNNCDAKNAKDNSKIYKYFSNSAQHYYRRGYQLPNKYELQTETPSISNTESECLFPSDKLCPKCNVRLKCYEDFCIRCQLEFFFKISEKQKLKWNNLFKNKRYTNFPRESNSYSLVCSNCERLYTLCPVCLAKNNVCHDCHQKRNVCMNCRRVLCIYCLDKSAVYGNNNVTQSNKYEEFKQAGVNKFKLEPQSSFKLLDLEYEALSSNEAEYDFSQPTPSIDIKSNRKSSTYSPFSLNMDCSSIYPYNQEGQLKQTSSIKPLPIIMNRNYSKLPSSDDYIEGLCNETHKSLAHYHKSKGNLERLYSQKKIESNNRSTQTTPESRARRDVVLHEEFNISMPLIREMPKTTRRNYKLKRSISLQRKMDNMIRKLDISK
ncbi:uncharacterized protein LOC119662671 [Teleopsis dalmanni]|uniref:uncharacterized protein LOC119662671 n=1 Tax=Teleopsis dalmanni TaxID=139649 RepID=UPI0018CF3F36|nr:uncharacterized protein LOC119662671 [Teleopsis dalmanni]